VLLGGAGVAVAGVVAAGVGVEKDVLPGRTFAYDHLGLNGPDGVIPDIEPGRIQSGSFASAARGTEVGYQVIFPPGDEDLLLPVVVALHWLGADAATLTSDRLGLDRYLAQHVADGGAPFVIAAADGGRGYWHPHDGDDAGAMVLDEFLPLLQEQGRQVASRVGWLGWSMGGYGALRLAGLRGREATSAVAVASPALWSDADEASPEGFSDAGEYREYSIFDQQDDLAGIPVRIDVGRGDPFYFEIEEYAEGLGADSEVDYERGGHSPGYWRRVLPAQLEWLGSRVQQPRADG
jgi:S-formylglutathione hydrolase FrmB